MMNFFALYDCEAAAGSTRHRRPLKIAVCTIFLVFIAFFTVTPTLAGGTEADPESNHDGFLRCAQTEPDEERLACFDHYMAPARSDSNENFGPAAGDLALCANLVQDSVRSACFDAAANAVSEPPVRQQLHGEDSDRLIQSESADSSMEFGEEQLETVAHKKSKLKNMEISAMVIDLRRNAFGAYSFYLDNGQIWQQTESARFVPPDSAFPVEIKRGAISGYRLHINNQNKILRVKRLQ